MTNEVVIKKDKTLQFISRFATHKNRWYALVIIALGLAIVIIDNTILNVSIPYILRDLDSTFSEIQWAISGYALTIAAILITVGRVGDLVGRKKMFLTGIIIFAIGSLIASKILVSKNIVPTAAAGIPKTSV